jgi:hypothetical protein
VTFGGTAGTGFSVPDDTRIRVTAPAHAAASGVPVVVQHPKGNATVPGGVTYV